MNIKHRIDAQLAEACSGENVYFCTQAGRWLENPHRPESSRDRATLLEHFIRCGGAADFARRYKEAMGDDNKWYCSEYHRTEISDPSILWSYYKKFCNVKREPPKSSGPFSSN